MNVRYGPYGWILFGLFCFISFMPANTNAGKAACHDPFYGKCYGILHTCPSGCPRLCEIDCRLCKPYCACDRPGAVCQDPRFIGGDGIMFYFHGKKDEDFCLLTDSNLHINGHFIGKRSNNGRDFTWVQSIGILFKSHQLYIGANKVAEWEESTDNMLIKLDRQDVIIPIGEGQIWCSQNKSFKIQRQAETNKVIIRVEGLFEIVARVVPIKLEESRVHGYEITDDDCFAHLELNFKFESLSKMVDGVLGQTYRPSYRSRVKMAAAMPIMGMTDKFATSYLFATDCVASKFGIIKEDTMNREPLSVECGSGFDGKGLMCKR